MTETKTKAATAPVAAPAKASKLATWEGFKVEIDQRADEIASQLPSNVSRDRFINAAISAVKATPDLLSATPRSLFAALVKAAQDGLLPDGREGIITVYRQKVQGSAPERYEMVAQWNPMFYGIRKRARELDGIIIDAQVVMAGDEFDYELGDTPRINHRPATRDKVMDASAGIAVYAIFRHPTEGILHREVMWKPEVFAVMNQSRAKTSLMWTTFWTEGWRKTVGRRGAKSVPVSPQLERLIQRDDENFSFEPRPAQQRIDPPDVPDEPKTLEISPSSMGEKVNTSADVAGDYNDDASGASREAEPVNVDFWITRLDEELSAGSDEATITEIWDNASPETVLAGNDEALQRAFDTRKRHVDRIAQRAEMKRQAEIVHGSGDIFPPDVPEE